MMHGDEKSVKDSDLEDLAGQYCFSLIAEYVPKHSSCILKNCKVSDVCPARQPRSGRWEIHLGRNWKLSNPASLTHPPTLCTRGREDPLKADRPAGDGYRKHSHEWRKCSYK